MNQLTLGSMLFMLCSVVWAPTTYFYAQSQSTSLLVILGIGLFGTALANLFLWSVVLQIPGISWTLHLAMEMQVYGFGNCVPL